jgi:hypothetical protein
MPGWSIRATCAGPARPWLEVAELCATVSQLAPGLFAARRPFTVINLLSKMFVFDLTFAQYPIRLSHKPNGENEREMK